MRSLLVEGNKRLAKALKRGLEQAGYCVDVAGDGAEAEDRARGTNYDMIVLDLMVSKVDGLALLRQWRLDGNKARIVVLKAKDGGPRTELKNSILRIDDLEINSAARTVHRAGQPIHLTPREFDLLTVLACHRGKVVTRTMLRGHFYTRYDELEEKPSNIVDVYIRYLRNKIDKGFGKPLILTRWGHGYLIRGDDE